MITVEKLLSALVPSAIQNESGAPEKRRGAYIDLLLISFLVLFFELSCIRFFGSTVVFLTFFTNIILMACFLGMSVGCLTASRQTNFIELVLPLAFAAVFAAMCTLFGYRYFSEVAIDVGNQTASPQVVYFGTEYRRPDLARFVIPLWVVAGIFFGLVATVFVGLGQVMGRAFEAIPRRIAAYTTNILGSLLGILAFFVISWFNTPPLVWFLVCGIILLYFITPWTRPKIVTLIGVLSLVAMASFGLKNEEKLFWSPYYKIRYITNASTIETNNISHQTMFDVQRSGGAYMLPYLLNRDAGFGPFKDVVIIGAGSGNDVAAALANDTMHIDAVEIDPVISQRGKEDHPNKPFADARVRVWYDDGRSFLNAEHGPYDLAIYALVDSLVLHSGFSSLRLENFLFTEQAFRDVKARLRPGAVFAMYNYYRQGWIVSRLKAMAERVFGVEPIVLAVPYQKEIKASDSGGGFTFILVGVPDEPGGATNKRLEAIQRKFAEGNLFWITGENSINERINGFAPEVRQLKRFGSSAAEPIAESASSIARRDDISPETSFQKIGPAIVDTGGATLWPTDNWPFLYLKDKQIPWKPSGQGILVIILVSAGLLLAFTWPVWFADNRSRRAFPDGQMFFLGAGFMLLETKGVVHMALLFGSTWVVNSVVFFAILTMILLANLFVGLVNVRNLLPFYLLLIAALLVNTLVPMDKFLTMVHPWRSIVSCSVVFAPIFFAGVIFAATFRDTPHADIAIGSNIAGVILGGVSENLSMMIGFNYLLGVAIAYYALSWMLKTPPLIEAAPHRDAELFSSWRNWLVRAKVKETSGKE